MIYTSYFANVSKLPDNFCAISISASPPAKWKGPQYKILAPTYDILMDYKTGQIDENTYTKRYEKDVLSKQDPVKTAKILKQIAGKKEVCIVCFEKDGDFCHRHIVEKWFKENGIECKEFTKEDA